MRLGVRLGDDVVKISLEIHGVTPFEGRIQVGADGASSIHRGPREGDRQCHTSMFPQSRGWVQMPVNQPWGGSKGLDGP